MCTPESPETPRPCIHLGQRYLTRGTVWLFRERSRNLSLNRCRLVWERCEEDIYLCLLAASQWNCSCRYFHRNIFLLSEGKKQKAHSNECIWHKTDNTASQISININKLCLQNMITYEFNITQCLDTIQCHRTNLYSVTNQKKHLHGQQPWLSPLAYLRG